MGSDQSQPLRSSHFQRPSDDTDARDLEDEDEEHHINISNKMVERLVEDATLAGGAAAVVASNTTPRGDFKDKIFMEKLRCLDENHSERSGLTVEDLSTIVTRIEKRTENMVSPNTVCVDCKQQLIDCYAENESDYTQCWNTVAQFKRCVDETALCRLRARTSREEREMARRERHVARARDGVLRDLAA